MPTMLVSESSANRRNTIPTSVIRSMAQTEIASTNFHRCFHFLLTNDTSMNSLSIRPFQIAFYLIVPCLLVMQVGCYDPTADKVDAGASAAKEEAKIEAKESDLEFALTGDNCDIKWTGSNSAGMTPHGFFFELTGKLLIDGETKEFKHFEVDIDTTSVKAMAEALTEKLKNKGFFEVDKFPKARFVTTSVSAPREDDPEGTTHVIEGNLQIRDVTKSIKFPAKVAFDQAGNSATLSSEFSINRKDYGVVYNVSVEDALIRDDVLINLDIDAETEK